MPPVPFRLLPAGARAAALGVVLALCAATPAPAARPDPTDPSAAVPPLALRPALADYKPMAPPPPRSWREVNDEVARIGGWRAYLREAHAPAPAAPAASAAHRHHGAPAGAAR